MDLKNQTLTASLVLQYRKARKKLERLIAAGKSSRIPFVQLRQTHKRQQRCLKKLLALEHPLSRAVTIIALSLLATGNAHGQCDSFIVAENANPLKRVPLPADMKAPVFVDIDNDGDLDCYGVYTDDDGYVKYVYLQNTGTKDFPLFTPDGQGGLPAETTFYTSYWAEGLVFADIDADGDYDCFISNYYYDRIKYYKNEGDKYHPSFVLQPDSENPLNFVHGSYGLYFNLVDMDKDGDYDLSTIDLYYNDFYRNDGTPQNPHFVRIGGSNFFGNPYDAHTIFEDFNRDGLIDVYQSNNFLHSHNIFYINIGTLDKPRFEVYDRHGVFPFTRLDDDLYSLVDLNNDGFLEAFSYNSEYAITAPIATITATDHTGYTRLDAYPKGNYGYRWRWNGKIIPQASRDFIWVNRPGSYNVEITGHCGTGISLPFEKDSAASMYAGTGDNAAAYAVPGIDLLLFPNPFTGSSLLSFRSGFKPGMTIRITDVLGRTVAVIRLSAPATRIGEELPAGTYFIEVLNGPATVFRKTLIKR